MSLWHVNLHRYLELFPCPHTIHVDLAVWPVQIWGKRHKDPDLRWSRLTTKLTQIGWLGPMRRRWCGIESPVVINGLSYNLWKVQNLHTSLAHKDNENFEFVWIQIVHFFLGQYSVVCIATDGMWIHNDTPSLTRWSQLSYLVLFSLIWDLDLCLH
jgi:hypothetical protein